MHPNLLHLGHFTLPTFGVLVSIGLLAALSLNGRSARSNDLGEDALWNAGIFAILSAFVLSRVLLVLGNLPSFRAYPILILTLPSLTPAGLALTAVATVAYLRWRRLPILRVLDAWAPATTLLWAFLALGHLAEGSDPGLPSTHLGLRIPPDPYPLHPVALYATIAAILLTLWLLRRSAGPHAPGRIASAALLVTGLVQFLLTFLRQPYPYLDPAAHLLDPMQYLALGMILASGLLHLLPTRHPSLSEAARHAL